MANDIAVVRVKQGQLRGVLEDNVYGGTYLAFRGVPFARPPIGQRRFKDPEPPQSWAGIRDASRFGTNCAQIEILSRQFVGDDDCLYLNVYRRANNGNTKLPVMFWIHGGGFSHGSGDHALYGPDYLVRKDVVLVTINYRLGVLGFLTLEHEIAPGNQGLKDQVMALKWVQENISSFGGDPDNVTIFGESAGACAVHYLAISPLAQGLFHKAISQSGVATNPWASICKDPKNYAYKLAAKLGEPSTDPKIVLNFLRSVEAKKLVNTGMQLLTLEQRYVSFGAFAPGIDDKSPNPFMPQHPSVMMKAGVKVPYIIGFNANEGSLFLTPFNEPNTEDSLRRVNEDFGQIIPVETKKYLAKEGISPMDVKQLYFGNEPISEKTMQQYADYISDTLFLQGIHDVINVQIEKGKGPTYMYQFNFYTEESQVKIALNIPLPGTSHADDLMYLFNSFLAKNANLDAPKEGTDKYKVMEYFTQMWTDFARTGNPTPAVTEKIPTIWEPLQKGDVYNYLSINTTLKMETSKKEGQRFDWKRIKNKL